MNSRLWHFDESKISLPNGYAPALERSFIGIGLARPVGSILNSA